MLLIVWILLSNLYPSIAAPSIESFYPLTQDKSLDAAYKLETFLDSKPHSTSEIVEHYQYNLQASNIRITESESNGTTRTTTYMYNTEINRDVEMVKDEDDSDESSSRCGRTLKVLPPSLSNPFDQIIFQKFLTEVNNKPSLNLDMFLLKECKEEINRKLQHVRGLTRLLQLIECRRREFELSSESSYQTQTRGFKATKYFVSNLTFAPEMCENCTNSVDKLSISVNVAQQTNPSKVLGERLIPLSISLSIEQLNILHIINIFKLELLDPNDRLESSLFLMPTGCGLHREMNSRSDQQSYRSFDKNHFSFRAKMSSQHITLNEPVELDVIYDRDLGLLARRIAVNEVVEKNQLVREESRLVMDARSNHKFHIMRQKSNNIHETSNPLLKWTTCSSDLINPLDLSSLETGDGSLFRLDRASFMGTSEIRNIPCNVYERKLSSFPLWLGFSNHETAYCSENGDIYITIYEAIGGTRSNGSNNSYQVRDDQSSGKLVKIDINIVGWTKPPNLILSYHLDIYQFSWALNPDLMHLFKIDQECFFTDTDFRYIDLELELEPDVEESQKDASSVMYQLREENLRQSRIFCDLLSKFVHVPPTQQSNLMVKTLLNGNLDIQVSIYNSPSTKLQSSFVGFTRDPSNELDLIESPLHSLKSISFQECEWKAAHTLVSDSQEHYHGPVRSFIFCRHSLNCLISDSVRSREYKLTHLRIPDEWSKYSVDASYENKCALYEITKLAIHKKPEETNGMRLVDWLLTSKGTVFAKPFTLQIDKQSLDLQVTRYRTSHIVSRAHYEQLKEVQGIRYDYPQENWLAFSSSAQCYHLCLTLDWCKSYSACQKGAEMHCLMSRLNWTEPSKVAELRRMALGNHLSQSPLMKLQVQVANTEGDNSESVEVNFGRSALCSIRQVDELDVFELGLRQPEAVVDDRKYLLVVDSISQCARFCLDRAWLLRRSQNATTTSRAGISESEDLWSDDWETCTGFKYEHMSHVCVLQPLVELALHHQQHTAPVPTDWQLAVGRASASNLSRLEDMESYEIRVEELFTAWDNTRLTSVEGATEADLCESRTQWQLSELDKTPAECARLCLNRSKCRSFDIISTTSSVASECILNRLSLADIEWETNSKPGAGGTPLRRAPTTPSHSQHHKGNQSLSNNCLWRHYEPSELALHLSGGGPRPGARFAGRVSPDWARIFPTAPALSTSVNVTTDHDYDTINKCPSDGNSFQQQQQHNSHWHLFTLALLILMLISGLIYYKAKRWIWRTC